MSHLQNQPGRDRISRAHAARAVWRLSAATMSDEMLCGDQVSAFFDVWCIGAAYSAGKVIAHDGALYRVIIAHTAQADWIPVATPTLFRALGVSAQEPDQLPEWTQPTGAHDAYNQGDRVRYQEATWRSAVNVNVHAPGVVPDQWILE